MESFKVKPRGVRLKGSRTFHRARLGGGATGGVHVSAKIRRALTIPSTTGLQDLEGVYLAAEGSDGLVVAAPHLLYGGSMYSPVVIEVAAASEGAGFASLRFNWRGIGRSTGAPSGDSDDADEDYEAVLAQVRRLVDGRFIPAGYSFGAAATLRVSELRSVEGLLLVAPPPKLLDPDGLSSIEIPCLIITAENDQIAPQSRWRHFFEHGPVRVW